MQYFNIKINDITISYGYYFNYTQPLLVSIEHNLLLVIEITYNFI
jgi:hypothetical protein